MHALFRNQEDTEGYFNLLEAIIAKQGIPLALYHDGHSIFEVLDKGRVSLEEELAGEQKYTQFGRLLNELTITSIRSHSPQARGRVERLWGTFQDRLVSHLRLSGARNIEQANQVLKDYLPVHNRKFAVPPAIPGSAFLKPEHDWRSKFCLKYTRVVGLDNVVRFRTQCLQVLPDGRYSYARARVEIRESFDGKLAVYYQNSRLRTVPVQLQASGIRNVSNKLTKKSQQRKPVKPAPDHPWRGKYRQFVD